MTQAQPPPRAAFAYDVAREAMQDQLRRIEAHDTKAGILIAAAGIFAGLLFSGSSVLAGAPPWLLALTGGLISLALLLALFAFLNQRYVTAPRPGAVARLARRDEPWLKWTFLGNLHGALEWNRRKLNRKTRLLGAAQAALIAAVTLVGGYFAVMAIRNW